MTKFKYGRARLTWDEIRQIEKDWKNDEGPARSAVMKLIKHIRFEAHLAEQNVSKPGIQKRLKQIATRVEKYAMQEPTGEYETCAVCNSPVAVHGGFDWTDGDACDECLVKFARHAREDIPWLLELISEKEGI